MNRIYYLGYYDIEKNKSENRNYTLAATNKMTYIIEALESCGHPVDVISASQTLNPVKCPAKCEKIGEMSQLHLFSSPPWGNKAQRVVSRFHALHQVYQFIIENLMDGDLLIVYHSLAYISLLTKAKRKIGFNLILEVEEIYGDVTGDAKTVAREMAFFPLADSYIFPTQLLDEKINTAKKPSVIIHGAYKVEADRNCKFDDDEIRRHNKRVIHCVYAGTFDPRKGGAIAAAAAAEYLPDNYHIHVLGFGSDEDVRKMKDLIAEISNRSDAKVTYDGLLSGEDYIRFIQSCDIGLSTQNPDAAFNATSFPSKILSYMANGLRVVSIRIPAIERSAVGRYMYYYDAQTPKEIAKAIIAVDTTDSYDGKKIISCLNGQFCSEMKELINNDRN